MIGSFVAGALLYAVYYDAIVDWEHKVRNHLLSLLINPSTWISTTLTMHSARQPFSTPSRFVWSARGVRSSMESVFDDVHAADDVQFVGTGLLLFGIFAVLDPRNHVGRGAQPALIGLMMVIIQIGFNYNAGLFLDVECCCDVSGSPINPARDMGPRIFTSFIYGSGVFTAGHQFWWIAITAPFVGAAFSSTLYRVVVNPA
jgi:glycerol uptake facilitator-like aquaporin